MKVIFLGTPEFSVPSLNAVLESGNEVVAVITAPDKPAGRGLELKMSPVKVFAMNNNLNVLQPSNLKDPTFLNTVKKLNADLQIVVAFRMMPEELWNMPPLGTFNLHASLLPNYRGAAPINWVIINGEKETGLTTFFLKHQIDTGDVIEQVKIPIGDDETAGELHDRMMLLGSKLVASTIDKIESNSYTTKSQSTLVSDPDQLKPAPKLFPADCEISWSQPAKQIHDHIRGLSPYPTAFSILISTQGKKLKFKIYRSAMTSIKANEDPGNVIIDKHKLYVACADDLLEIKQLQVEGKKQVNASDFINGLQNMTAFRLISN